MADITAICDHNISDLIMNDEKEIDDNDKDFKDVLEYLGKLSGVSDCGDQVLISSDPLDRTEISKEDNVVTLNCNKQKRDESQKHVEFNNLSCFSQASVDSRSSGARIESQRQEIFPIKLYKLLEKSDINGHSSIISWLPHGRAFLIHDVKLFETQVLKKYSFQCKFESFKRQLYMYGFKKIGKRFIDSGAYRHENFIRGDLALCRKITKQKVPFHDLVALNDR